MKEFENCPNCGTAIKSGFFNSTEIIDQKSADFLNEFLAKQSEAYCSKCSANLLTEAKGKWTSLNNSLNASLKNLIGFVPVVTLQIPHEWKYKVVSMVTAQSVTGTGVFAEFASSFTDLFGMQSNKYNTKLKGGENLCKTQLRLAAVSQGANAVIAVDIDYAEVGGEKGMLMVCMSGTAVRLENPEVLGENYIERFEEMNNITKELYRIAKYKDL